jgi:hypothetical protein
MIRAALRVPSAARNSVPKMLSYLRLVFAVCLPSDDSADLQTALTRIIVYTGNRASVADITTSMLFWNDRTRAAWAADYYAASFPETSTEMVNANV